MRFSILDLRIASLHHRPQFLRIRLHLGHLTAQEEVHGLHAHRHIAVLVHHFDQGMDDAAIRLGA